jgi:hypothetical protein
MEGAATFCSKPVAVMVADAFAGAEAGVTETSVRVLDLCSTVKAFACEMAWNPWTCTVRDPVTASGLIVNVAIAVPSG